MVLNHTLFFGLMAQAEDSEEAGFVFPGDFVILDEAHMIENIAARQLGVQLSEPHLNYELLRMYNPRTHKGLLKPLNNPSLFQRVQDVMDASGLFFQNARDDLGFAGSGKIVRILQPEWSQDILSQPLMELIGELKTEREKQEENAAAKDELADMAARMEEAQASLKVLMDMTEEGHVYWAERSGPDGRNMSVCSAPVEVGDILRERLVFRRTFRHSDFRHAGDRRCGHELFCGARRGGKRSEASDWKPVQLPGADAADCSPFHAGAGPAGVCGSSAGMD